jgi:hypothetical protein
MFRIPDGTYATAQTKEETKMTFNSIVVIGLALSASLIAAGYIVNMFFAVPLVG